MITDSVHRLDQFLTGIGSYAQFVDEIYNTGGEINVSILESENNPDIDIYISERDYEIRYNETIVDGVEMHNLIELTIQLLEGRNK
jgi:hypothetical protein